MGTIIKSISFQNFTIIMEITMRIPIILRRN